MARSLEGCRLLAVDYWPLALGGRGPALCVPARSYRMPDLSTPDAPADGDIGHALACPGEQTSPKAAFQVAPGLWLLGGAGIQPANRLQPASSRSAEILGLGSMMPDGDEAEESRAEARGPLWGMLKPAPPCQPAACHDWPKSRGEQSSPENKRSAKQSVESYRHPDVPAALSTGQAKACPTKCRACFSLSSSHAEHAPSAKQPVKSRRLLVVCGLWVSRWPFAFGRPWFLALRVLRHLCVPPRGRRCVTPAHARAAPWSSTCG